MELNKNSNEDNSSKNNQQPQTNYSSSNPPLPQDNYTSKSENSSFHNSSSQDNYQSQSNYQPQNNQQWQENYQQPNYYQQSSENPPTNGLAIASLVLGILSIPAGCCYGAGIIFAIIGLILGFVSKKPDTSFNGMAIAGIICSIIGILVGIGFWVIVGFSFTAFGDFSDIINDYRYY